MKPYFERDGIVIFHGDCRDVLPTIPAGSVDLVLTDPPYGIGFVTKTSDFRDSEAFDRGHSLRASVLYNDSPEAVREIVRQVFPKLLRRWNRAIVFPGPEMLFEYPLPDGSDRNPADAD